MGIPRLLPFLKSIQQPICISELAGSTIGVDAYCWLHKGAYGCALELAEGNDTDMYVNYVMKRVNMMLYYNLKPILVFDGGYLPSKSEKEAERRNKRQDYRSQGIAHLKNGNRTQAFECFQKSVDITPEMALNVIKACREKGVDCIVAPYEADAQLAYLTKAGITQYTISEDSDLLVYGCEKVIFKMDANGSGLIIDLKQLPKLKDFRMDDFTHQKFRQMCILSGCDYLQSVKGVGIAMAHKLVKRHSTLKKLISSLRLNTKMRVPADYEERFKKAEQTFLYQIVFDPKSNKLVPLNPVPDDIDSGNLSFAGHSLKWKQEQALDLALGNLNPLTGERMESSTLTAKTHSSSSVKKTKYDAEKNVSGAIRKTKSSEKANSQFVTPVRCKRTRETDEQQEQRSKLARLYSTIMDDVTVDVNFEATESRSEVAPKIRIQQPQLKIKRNNPFRSPVVRKSEARTEQVVSRFFGLAGMEVAANEQYLGLLENAADDDALTNSQDDLSENKMIITNSQGSSSSHEDDGQFQESGYQTSSETNTPTENDADLPLTSVTPPFPTFSTPLSGKAPTDSPPLPTFPTTPTSSLDDKTKKFVSGGKRSGLCTQVTLDLFAFKKDRTFKTEGSQITTGKISPTRTILADRSSPNFKTRRKFNETLVNEVDDDDENVKENNGNTSKNTEYKVEIKQDKLKSRDTSMAIKQPRLLGLRSKPSTGLGRCRGVGLSHPRKNIKDSKNKTNPISVPILSYFKYQARDKISQGTTS
ncbi:exonuclease 1-like isoform X2 [Dendronephthya gigantea]|uniref:exonuclease 1-like isoform X2 n=1 Tax=Dendronephthya gigantea TaxID=151771 RepID=UPI00106B6D14|nr:exonuclease 1-like isoform X2 [Dendronephthya gigantea]